MVKEKFERFDVSKIDLERVNFSDILEERNPIIFDTNFLFVTFEFRVDIISEIRRVISSKYSLYIYEGTIKELAAIQEKKDKNKRFLPLISKMLKLYGFKIIKSQKDYIDAQIIENMDKRIIVATNDKNLRHKIKRLGSRVLYLRQKNYLDLM